MSFAVNDMVTVYTVSELKVADSSKVTVKSPLLHVKFLGVSPPETEMAGSVAVRFILLVNVMDQYQPSYHAVHYPEISRTIFAEEYTKVREYAKDKGFRLTK